MGISVRDRKLLWGRSGNRCAFETCRRLLVINAEESGATAVVAQEAHIVGEKEEGPRGESLLTWAQRDAYPNRMLLCLQHHKIVDDAPDYWTVNRLLTMKATHEKWVEEVTSPEDKTRLANELLYAQFVDKWVERARIDNWEDWTSFLLAPTPQVETTDIVALDDLRCWLFSRPWPQVYPHVELAFETFRRVADDLHMAVSLTFEEWGSDRRLFARTYKKQWVGNYDELAEEAEWVVALIHDLVFELTRAANLVLDTVREWLDPLFRVDEGVLTLQRQGAGLYFERFRPRYRPDELTKGVGYSNIRDFVNIRNGRDVHFGEGMDEGGWRAITPVRLGD